MKLKHSIILMLAIAILSSCTDDTLMSPQGDTVPASIRVTTAVPELQTESRAVNTGTTLPDGAQIGTAVLQSSDASVYNGYANVCWTASGTGDAQTWSSASEVELGLTRCICYGYYPYNPDVTDIRQVPIEVASQTDYMYAHPYPDFWMGYPEAELTMHHALAVMRVTVKAGSSFSGVGYLQSFRMTGDFPATATMDAMTGELSDFQGKAGAISLSGVTLTTAGTTIEQIVIPDGGERPFNMGIRVDGKTYGLGTSYTHTIEAGNIYTYTVTVNSTGAAVSNVDIEPWTSSAMGAQSAQVAPSVSVAGDTQGIAVSTAVADDGSVVLTAVPVTDDRFVNAVTLTTDGAVVMDQILDDATGIRTVTLTGVNGPCVIHFTGTTVSGYNVQATYDVPTSRSVSVSLLSSSVDFDMAAVTRMIVDGEVVTPSAVLDLSEGLHTVSYRLTEGILPPHMFDGVTSLVSTDLGSGITSIGDYAFNGCTAFIPTPWPATVTQIGSYAFAGCSSVTELTIPVTVTSLGTAAFSGCTGLKTIDMQSTALSGSLFSGCTALTAFTVPEGTVTIGADCFRDCTSLAEVSLPSTLTAIGDQAFGGCSALATIYTGSMTAPAIESATFAGVTDAGTLYVETDATGYDTWLAAGSGLEDWEQKVNSYYIVDLNDQWQASSVPNPDDTLYEGVYESFSNYNVNNSAATMTIKVKGYETFTIYIRSYAESSYDFVMASELDQAITKDTSYSNTTLVKGHTRGKQSSATAIGNYTELTYALPDKDTEYTITVLYKKDSSSHSGTDKGYLLIKKQ